MLGAAAQAVPVLASGWVMGDRMFWRLLPPVCERRTPAAVRSDISEKARADMAIRLQGAAQAESERIKVVARAGVAPA